MNLMAPGGKTRQAQVGVCSRGADNSLSDGTADAISKARLNGRALLAAQYPRGISVGRLPACHLASVEFLCRLDQFEEFLAVAVPVFSDSFLGEFQRIVEGGQTAVF